MCYLADGDISPEGSYLSIMSAQLLFKIRFTAGKCKICSFTAGKCKTCRAGTFKLNMSGLSPQKIEKMGSPGPGCIR